MSPRPVRSRPTHTIDQHSVGQHCQSQPGLPSFITALQQTPRARTAQCGHSSTSYSRLVRVFCAIRTSAKYAAVLPPVPIVTRCRQFVQSAVDALFDVALPTQGWVAIKRDVRVSKEHRRGVVRGQTDRCYALFRFERDVHRYIPTLSLVSACGRLLCPIVCAAWPAKRGEHNR